MTKATSKRERLVRGLLVVLEGEAMTFVGGSMAAGRQAHMVPEQWRRDHTQSHTSSRKATPPDPA